MIRMLRRQAHLKKFVECTRTDTHTHLPTHTEKQKENRDMHTHKHFSIPKTHLLTHFIKFFDSLVKATYYCDHC